MEQKSEEAIVDAALNRVSVPRNWDFYMSVMSNSDSITPNYAYDDGVFTYLGFDNTKTFPSVFGYDDKQEHILNTHIKKDGNYDVLVIQKIMPQICEFFVKRNIFFAKPFFYLNLCFVRSRALILL